jgi:hypothetical protein
VLKSQRLSVAPYKLIADQAIVFDLFWGFGQPKSALNLHAIFLSGIDLESDKHSEANELPQRTSNSLMKAV